ncbi:UNVERIFIED_CONTAM: putative cytochrome c biogenesis ccmB-like mitochondrial protein [Sesamum calycinum]|uniref:Cytochrome c biogenesis ccmB-like mitochondrial protein n=1 Tax=Sesamum calycinum TaxID=2727403 RepID=A0AAW2IVQ5_9LAMI
MLQLPYQFGRSGMDRLNIPLGSLVLTLLCGIHSRSALGITSSSGWNSSQNPTTSPTSLPPTLSRTSIETEWFHVLSSIGYSSPFVSLFPISVSISFTRLNGQFSSGPSIRLFSKNVEPVLQKDISLGLGVSNLSPTADTCYRSPFRHPSTGHSRYLDAPPCPLVFASRLRLWGMSSHLGS